MVTEDVNFSVTFKTETQSDPDNVEVEIYDNVIEATEKTNSNATEEETAYEVMSREPPQQTPDATAAALVSRHTEADRILRYYQLLACCLWILCVVLMIAILIICVYCAPCFQQSRYDHWPSYNEYNKPYRPYRGTWDEARDDCRRRSSDLTVVAGQNEKTSIGCRGPDITGYWIGLRAVDRKWKWIDGTDLTNRTGMPPPVKDGLCVVSLQNQEWKSVSCEDRNAWICEKKTVSV